MEVGILLGTCNNAPAEWISPEKGWLLIVIFTYISLFPFIIVNENKYFFFFRFHNITRKEVEGRDY